jgi:hypothetical protein
MYPTSQWRQGETIADIAYVPISPLTEAPVLVRFNVGLYDRSTGEELPALARVGGQLDYVWVGEAPLEPYHWPETDPLSPADTIFGPSIRLAGIDLPSTTARPGDVISVTLEWQALDQITEEYVGFVHLVDPLGQDVTQDDHPPLNGGYPTRYWREGTVVRDPYRLPVPNQITDGVYELWGGMYHFETHERLPATVQGTGERWRDDLVHVGNIVITVSNP